VSVLRRLLSGPGPGTATVIGQPASWASSELQRVRAAASRMFWTEARPLLLPSVAVVVLMAVGQLLSLPILGVIGLLGLLVLGRSWLQRPWPHEISRGWESWASARHRLDSKLLMLGPDWRVLSDRRIDGLPSPATIAVGPPGVWAIWLPEPGLPAPADIETAANYLAELVPVPTGCTEITANQIHGTVHAMATAPVQAGVADINRAAEALGGLLLQEPVTGPETGA